MRESKQRKITAEVEEISEKSTKGGIGRHFLKKKKLFPKFV